MGAYAFLLFAVFVLPCSHGCGEGSPKDRADPDFDSDSNSDPDSDSDSNSDPDSDPDSDSDSDPAPLNSICGNGVCEEGEDVSDIWKGADRSRANPLFWRTSKSNAMVSMVQENWKLHIEGESVELYDLSKDAGETGNLADKYPDIAKKMRNKAKRWESQLPMDYAKETDPPKNDPVERPRVVGPAPLQNHDEQGKPAKGPEFSHDVIGENQKEVLFEKCPGRLITVLRSGQSAISPYEWG